MGVSRTLRSFLILRNSWNFPKLFPENFLSFHDVTPRYFRSSEAITELHIFNAFNRRAKNRTETLDLAALGFTKSWRKNERAGTG